MEERKNEPNLTRWDRVKQSASALTDCSGATHRRNPIQRAWCTIHRLSDAFSTHQCSLMACACAYCAVLSLIPLLAVGVSVFGFVVGDSDKALHQVLVAINSYVPVNTDFMKDILNRIREDKGLIGLVGLTGLLWAAHQTFLAMIPAMNMIWDVPEKRHWGRQRLIAIGATLATLALLGADLAASTAIASLEGRSEPFFSSNAASLLFRIVVYLTPMLLTTLLFALLYRILPSCAVPWKAAFVGASVGALLWELTKIGFGIFLLHFHTYDRLYGSISGVIILVVWVYYSMAILLLGAEIAADNESRRRGGEEAAHARAHSGADLLAAHGVAPHHAETNPPAPAPSEDAPTDE